MSASPGKNALAVCVVQDAKLRRAVDRAIRSAGVIPVICDSLAGIDAEPRLLFIDAATRASSSADELAHAVGGSGSVVIIGDTLEDNDIAALLRERHLDHLISDGDDPDAAELLVTTVKHLSGDIFGIEKYLPWGARIHQFEVGDYDDKRTAIDALAKYAKEVGARRALLARLEHVSDELLMNALYDAPAIHEGVDTLSRISALPRASVEDAELKRATLRFGSDGHYLVVSATDLYGELRKEVIFDHLVRARLESGKPNSKESSGGAGLGLYFVLSSVTRFIANITPGQCTEVMVVFDLRRSGRDMDTCAKSVHIFHSAA